VETFAALPAVIDRAAQLIEAGYLIGIWSGVADEEPAELVALAEQLCAAVLSNGGAFGRFAVLMDKLPGMVGRPQTEVEAAVALGGEQGWLRHETSYVELRAAGIHVAKEKLGLLRRDAGPPNLVVLSS
jgi:hypothetical protein